MTLLIACLVIYAHDFHGFWYVIAVGVWVFSLGAR